MGVVLFKAAFHGKSPFPSQAGKGLSTPYKEIGQQKSAVKADRTHLPVQSGGKIRKGLFDKPKI